MTTTEAIKELQKEHDLIQGEKDIDGSQFAPALLEALAMAIDMMSGKGDTISRQDAIDALKGLPTWWADSGGYYGGAQPPMEALLDPEDAISALENLPSAQPEREKGEWIDGFMCSVCRKGYRSQPTIRGVPIFKYCPECGADMRGEQDE